MVVSVALGLFALLAWVPMVLSGAEFVVENAFPKLLFDVPIDLQNAGDGSNRLFVVEMGGRVIVFENDSDVSASVVFLDISGQLLFNSRQGFRGIAFHPQYEDNGRFFVHYNAPDPDRTVISEFQVSPGDSNLANPNSEIILLEVGQPNLFHNGGGLVFGPDGYLYLGLGDGGPVNGLPDGDNNGQRRDTLLGAFLRLDIDRTENGLNYAIPPDNPFVGNTEGWREEIWAWGFRNPWRYAFDPVTGLLWTSDTGESTLEEIDIVYGGKNYGWRIMEGTSCFLETNCDTSGLTLPIYEYGGNARRQAVIGGLVYRGKRNPELVGRYVFTDFLRSDIWALDYDGANFATRTTLASGVPDISSFGVDEDNELYFVRQIAGTVHRFQPTATPVQSSSWSDMKRRYQE